MPFDDRTSDGASAVRSLSEQLRDLEAQLGHENVLSLPRIARRTKLPTHLGRPIGLLRPEGFPRLSSLTADPEARRYQPEPALSPGAAFRRGAMIVGVGLLLLATTAIVPPLFLHHPAPKSTQPQIPDQLVAPQRTARFAQSARELRDAAPVAVSSPPAPRAQQVLTHAAAPEPARPPGVAHLRPPITLAVAENETARLDLPTIVTGIGSAAAAGSAIVIDGLPNGTRVSHGIPIASESWTVASSDVEIAVVFLPRNTPDRLDLHVRVVAADSQELAANTLEIRVLRTTDVTAPIAPASDTATARRGAPPATARFEPAAAEGQAATDFIVSPTFRKLPPPRPARSPARRTATSAWTPTSHDVPPSATLVSPPPRAPFGK